MKRLALLLALAFLVGSATGLRAEPPRRSIAPLVQPGESVELLVAEGGRAQAQRLVPLDPLTLVDRAGGTPIELGGPSGGAIISADGSTLVRLHLDRTVANPYPSDVQVMVNDPVSGELRASYVLPFTLNGPSIRLSRDGSRLVLGEYLGMGARYARMQWHVVETATGSVLATVPPDPDGRWSNETWIDPDAAHLYRMLLPNWPDHPGPGPGVVVAHDLTTGDEIGRLEVPEVQGGSWDTGEVLHGYPVLADMRPGGAISPDGRRLALVHADADKVTLINLEQLAVERTISFAPEASIGDRILSVLPLMPRGAAAKVPPIGTHVFAVFAADGRHLYISGDETSLAGDQRVSVAELPIRLIDTERGDVVAEAAVDGFVAMGPSADGRSLYIRVSHSGGSDGTDEPATVLRRLDALTLDVRAERSFAGYPTILLRPAIPNGSDIVAL